MREYSSLIVLTGILLYLLYNGNKRSKGFNVNISDNNRKNLIKKNFISTQIVVTAVLVGILLSQDINYIVYPFIVILNVVIPYLGFSKFINSMID